MTTTSRARRFAFAASMMALNLAVAVVFQLAWSGSPSGASAALKPAPAAPVSEEEKLIRVVEKASPAVVSILVEQEESSEMMTILQELGRGTGFLISADGMIITNRHVAGDRKAKYTVFLADERKFDAAILDIDPVNDLALLKINAKGLPALVLETDDKLRIGQTVIAIGNALGKYANTVTRGILSGIERNIEASNEITGKAEQLNDILQTDAAINSGNSGGPLLNLDGKVIGVNTAIEFGAQGLGFAIPVSETRKMLESYRRYGAIARPRLGVRYVMLTPDVAVERKLGQTSGALVVSDEPGESPVLPGSPAATAGLHENDIIIEVNGKKLVGKYTLAKAIQSLNVGDAVTLKVLRGLETLILTTHLDAHPPYGK